MSDVRVWRVEQAQFAKAVRLGNGARLHGGRWNSPGRGAIYCAGSLSLAMLEILAHVTTEEDAGIERVFFHVDVSTTKIEEVRIDDLPRNWRSALDFRPCRKFGDEWLNRAAAAVLKVPSAINPLEHNFILNPTHSDFAKVLHWSRAKQFKIDARLLQNFTPTP